MKIVIQRVASASVCVQGETVASIGRGLLALIAFKRGDGRVQIQYGVEKLLKLRFFPDKEKGFEQSVVASGGSLLIVSQFTLYGDCKKGNRPSFSESMSSDQALVLYKEFMMALRDRYDKVQEGVFGADMQISLINDGPATVIIEK